MEIGSDHVDIIWQARQEAPAELGLDAFFAALFDRLELDDVEICVMIVNDARMQRLNREYRSVDRTTDVLAFAMESPSPPGGPRHLGDLAISFDRAQSQADEIGQSLAAEIRFLCLHGALHLLGHDHETDDGEMLRLQSRLKRELAVFFQ